MHGKTRQLLGQKFGHLTVIEFIGTKAHKAFWRVSCDCGKSITVAGSSLTTGNTRSCGCQRKSPYKRLGTLAKDGKKICAKCRLEKTTEEFPGLKEAKDGFYTWCRVCTQHSRRAVKYGLSVSQFHELVNKFNRMCYSCRDRPGEHVDHCHKTEKIRGWLCRGCNSAAGHLADSPAKARALANYLEQSEDGG